MRVYVEVDERTAVIVPEDFLINRYGVDYVRLRQDDGHTVDIVVQRGRETDTGVEILGGIAAGDVLVKP